MLHTLLVKKSETPHFHITSKSIKQPSLWFEVVEGFRLGVVIEQVLGNIPNKEIKIGEIIGSFSITDIRLEWLRDQTRWFRMPSKPSSLNLLINTQSIRTCCDKTSSNCNYWWRVQQRGISLQCFLKKLISRTSQHVNIFTGSKLHVVQSFTVVN